MKRHVIAVALFSIVVVSAGLLARHLLLGTTLNRPDVTNYSRSLNQHLAAAGDSGSNPTEGTDYTIAEKHYFDGRQWLVVKIASSQPNAGDKATVVMKLAGDEYQVVLGPGTNFEKSDTKDLPDHVVSYLQSDNLIANGTGK